MSVRMIGTLGLALALTGCASEPKYACGTPSGVTCRPVSAVYAAGTGAALADSSGDARSLDAALPLDAAEDAPATTSSRVVATVRPGDPVLTTPRVLRLWVAPWEDAGGDLHDETYLYLRIDDGRWALTP